MTIHEEARFILQRLEAGTWKWMRVKQFDPDSLPDIQSRYDALMKHHGQETGFLIETVKRLCTALAADGRTGS